MMNSDKHPKDRANFVSNFFFWWQLRIVKRMLQNKPIDANVGVEEQDSKKLGDKFELQWSKEMNRKTPSLIRALIKLFGLEFTIYAIFYFPVDLVVMYGSKRQSKYLNKLGICSRILQAHYLGRLLDYFVPNQTAISTRQVYVYGLVVASASYLRVLSLHIFSLSMTSLGLKVKVACSTFIYRKLLRMKMSTIQNVTLGKLINLLSNDMERFDRGFAHIHFIWLVPARLILLMVYIGLTYSSFVLIGSSVVFLIQFLQVLVFKQIAVYREEVVAKTDHRIRLVNVIVNGIQAVKMYAWEKPFEKLVYAARRPELVNIAKANCVKMLNSSSMFCFHKLAILECILPVVLAKQPLTAKFVFTLTSIYEMLLYFLRFLGNNLATIAEVRVAIQRIQEFLVLEHKQATHIDLDDSSEVGIFAKDLRVKWEQLCALDGVDFCVLPCELVAITGVAGCGKTTLLQAILKEIEPDNGSLRVVGRLSYAPQDPWIFSATIKENILFGDEFNEKRYSEVVRVCALERDLSLFAHGDDTLVGERGVMLSGGQKARISLARAVYRDCDLYLLDDPLAGVDGRVAKHIYEKCILKFLNKKCVVLVTHQMQYLKQVDRLYVIQNGKMRVEDSNTNFPYLVSSGDKPQSYKRNDNGREVEVKESSTDGTISPYISYMAAGGYKYFCFQIVLFAVVQCNINSLDYLLSIWSNLQESSACLYIFLGLFLTLSLASSVNSFLFTSYCKKVSRTMHVSLFRKILHGSLYFFNNHSSGRILNRFSQDLGTVDEVIPFYLCELLRFGCWVFGNVILINIVNHWMAVPTLIMFIMFSACAMVFRSTLKELKMVENLRRSPAIAHISATIQGLSVIKALGAEKHMELQFNHFQNIHTSVRYLYRAVLFSLSFWIDFLCASYIVCVVLLLLWLRNGTNSGSIGLAISQSMGLVGTAQYFTKVWCEVDMLMTSVGRVVEYSDLEPEKDTGKLVPPESWPSRGQIVFRSVSMRYSPDKPLVLNQVNLNIKPGEKVAIIGRTGAGKSSLVSVIFRLFDFDGFVSIDGFNTKYLPLSVLRSRIITIPQEPVLFLGTLRQNLDPFEQFKDEELWSALEEVALKQWVAGLPSGFETQVLEGGCNFSVGERQLLCLIRAILKKSKVVVLDEATASVDSKTDHLIQVTIRRKFQDATVLTIAHRLNTIMDSDKIVVLDGGVIVEFGSPQELLQNSESYFYKSVNQIE